MHFSLKLLLAVGLALVLFGAGYAVRTAQPVEETSLANEMDSYCNAKLNEDLSKLSEDDRRGMDEKTFFSRKLHTCVQIDIWQDPKRPEAMNYVLSDLTHGFTAPATLHPDERPFHIVRTDYGSSHHIYVEGYWKAVGSDRGQQPIASANSVRLTCDYDSATQTSNPSNICTEIQGYTSMASLQVDQQTYHIASWNSDEIIATDVERGLSGSTTATLLIHPNANEIEVVDRTNMDTKQPKLLDGMAGKSFGDHYELKGGRYLLDTQGTFFQCDQDGIVTDMRFDVVRKYHGDVVNVPDSEWNAGSKADHKFTQRECESAMERKMHEMK